MGFINFREPIVLRQPLENDSLEPILDQDNELLTKFKEYRYGPEKMTWDPNCYECKVRYRDPKAKDLVMYLHAWRYKVKNGPVIMYSCFYIKRTFHSLKTLCNIYSFNYFYISPDFSGTGLAISNPAA